MNSVLLFVFCGQNDLMQMRFTLRCVLCMATSFLRDQQYTFGVRCLLVAEKALLIMNDLTSMLLWWPMPRLPQVNAFVWSDWRMLVSDIIRHTNISGDSVHIHNHLKFWKVSARWLPKQLKPEQQALFFASGIQKLVDRWDKCLN